MADGTRFESIWADPRDASFSQGWLDPGGVNTRDLHGVGGHAEAHVRNLEAHSAYSSVRAIDLIDHGRTDRATTGLEIPNNIEHVLAVLKVASRLAADHPGKVDRLVLNTAAGWQADRS